MKKPEPEEKKTEYWDLFRADGRLEKVIPSRGYKIPKDMYHKAVEIIPIDRAGHMLVTQRSFLKKIGPGKLEFPAGSVLSGEQPYIAAKRELFEETGLQAASVQKLGQFNQPRIQRIVYLGYVPNLETAQVTLQKDETIGYAVITFEEWIRLLGQERFETSKLRYYSKQMLVKLEEAVGKPIKPKVEVPVARQLQKTTEDLFSAYRIVPLSSADLDPQINLQPIYIDEEEEEEWE